MWQEERYQRIRALLSSLQQVSTDRIVGELGVSRETVRRDLLELEAMGELRRVHGGAVPVHSEPPIAERVHTRGTLLDKVWGDHVFIEERTVDVHVKRLRESLGEASGMVETVRGAGYRLTAMNQTGKPAQGTPISAA